MNPDLILIFGFIVVIFIVMMRTISTATQRQIAHKERLAELKRNADGGLGAEAAARIENMEQRLRVLERIATDSGSNVSADLAREIEALRHEQDGRHEQHVADSGVQLNLKEKVQ